MINVNKLMIGIEIVFVIGCMNTAIIFHEDLNIIRFIYGTYCVIVMVLLLELIRFILNQDWTGRYWF